MESKKFADCVKLSNGDLTISQDSFTHIQEQKPVNMVNTVNEENKLKINDNLELSKYNLEGEIKNYLIIGKRACGKSYLVKNIILQINKKFPSNKYILFTSINQYSDIFSNCEKIITSNYKEELTKLYNYIINEKEKGDISTYTIIIDDIYEQLQIFEQIILNGRHYNINIIMCQNFPQTMKPLLRCNFDTIMIFKDDFIDNKKRLYEYYFGVIPTFKIFNQIMEKIDYKCLVFESNSNDNSLCSKVKFYLANNEELKNNTFSKLKLFLPHNNKNDDDSDCENNEIFCVDDTDDNLIIKQIEKNNYKIKKLTEKNKILLEKLIK